MKLEADRDYKVIRYPDSAWEGGARRGQVQRLACLRCDFYVLVVPLQRPGDKSGQGRYNRARGIIVKHFHAAHS